MAVKGAAAGDQTGNLASMRALFVTLVLLTGAGAGLYALIGGAPEAPAVPRGAAPSALPPTAKPAPVIRRPVEDPNIVLILADDMRRDDLGFMPQTRHLLEAAGTSYSRAYVSLAQCCPSRASLLSGRYAHNTGVLANEPPNGGYEAFAGQPMIGDWLRSEGYETAYVGKYLNGYGQPEFASAPTDVPDGWDHWAAFANHTAYRMFGFELNVNGALVSYGEDPADYQTDVLAEHTANLLARQAAAEEPFFTVFAPLAPHREDEDVAGYGAEALNPRPAPRHRHLAEQMTFRPQNSPAFNELERADKPTEVRSVPRRPPARYRRTYRGHVTSLFALDDAVARLVESLRRSGELDQTVIVFTSDNGLAFGEHGLHGKDLPYEETSGVPLLIRGPGFEAGESERLAANVDLAPTFFDLAGAPVRAKELDGRSLLSAGARGPILLEGGDLRYRGVHSGRFVYLEWGSGDRELYDLEVDPDQLENLIDARPALAKILSAQLDELVDCAGAECRL